jgi:CubicO group peptidase (beta-lactamase class C family)
LARIGYLLLHRGRWRTERGDEQVLLPQTVSRVTQWAPELATATFRVPNLGAPGKDDAQHYYGYLFWTNRTHQGLGRDVPADAFYMSGWGKQICCVIPSLDMVVVRLGPHRPLNDQIDYFPRFLAPIMAAVVDDRRR